MSLVNIKARTKAQHGELITGSRCDCCKRWVEYLPRTWTEVRVGMRRNSTAIEKERVHFCPRCWPVAHDLLKGVGAP
jgi:hypothetical protein